MNLVRYHSLSELIRYHSEGAMLVSQVRYHSLLLLVPVGLIGAAVARYRKRSR